jgi:hypothetical protein
MQREECKCGAGDDAIGLVHSNRCPLYWRSPASSSTGEECLLCGQPFKGSDWVPADGHGIGKCIDATYLRDLLKADARQRLALQQPTPPSEDEMYKPRNPPTFARFKRAATPTPERTTEGFEEEPDMSEELSDCLKFGWASKIIIRPEDQTEGNRIVSHWPDDRVREFAANWVARAEARQRLADESIRLLRLQIASARSSRASVLKEALEAVKGERTPDHEQQVEAFRKGSLTPQSSHAIALHLAELAIESLTKEQA